MKAARKLSLFIVSVIIGGLVFFFQQTSIAADRYAVSSGNWASTNTWSASSGGLAGASVPGPSDNVYIENAIVVSLNADANCLSLTMNPSLVGTIGTVLYIDSCTLTVGSGGVKVNGADLSLRACKILFTSNSSVMIVNGNFAIGSGSSDNNSAIVKMNYGGDYTSNLYVTGSTSMNPADGKFIPGTNSTFHFTCTGSQTIDMTNLTYANISINNTSEEAVSFGGAVTTSNVTGNISIQNGLVNLNGDVALNNSKALTVSSGAILHAGTNVISFGTSGSAVINGTLKTENANGLSGGAGTTFSSSNNPTITLAESSLIEYSGSSQTVSAMSYGHLTFSGSGTKSFESGTTDIAGNFTISGSASVDATTNSSTVNFNGKNTSQTITGASTFYNISISNTFASGSLTLNSPVTVSNLLTLTSGQIYTTATNILTLGSGTVTNTGNASSYINGPMKYIVANSGSNICNLPIGKDAAWRPAIITVEHTDASPVTYTAEVINSSAIDLGYSLPSDLLNVSDVRFWRINRENVANALISATVQLFYGDDDGVTDYENLRIAKNIGSGLEWYNVGGVGTANGSGSITSDPFSSFSDFTPSNGEGGANALPIELLSFEATANKNQVDISWSTASEINNDYFTIERSADGIRFIPIETIKGAGNSVTVLNYKTADLTPLPGVSYYRLKQIDFDGKYEFSNLVAVNFIKNESVMNVYPNPLQKGSILNVEVAGQIENKEVLIVVVDMSGREYFSKVVVLDDNENVIAIDPKEKLPYGVYLVTGSVDSKLHNRKLIVK